MGTSLSKVFIGLATFLVSILLAVVLVKALPGHYNQDETKSTPRAGQEAHHTDWTKSWDYPDESLINLISRNLGYSLILQSISFILVLLSSFVLSLLSLRSKVFSQILDKILCLGISAPSLFWIPLLVYFFSLKLDLFPLRFEPTLIGWILPLLSLSLRPLCLSTEILLLEWKQAEGQSYFLVARSKGLSRLQVFIKHGLKNALIPYTAQMGNFLVQSIIGSVLVECLFSFPGIGLLFVQSLQNRDLPVVLSLTILFTLIMMLVHAAVEILHSWLEPRGSRNSA